MSAAHALPVLLRGLATAIPPVTVTGLALDSRRVQAGDLFFAFKGSLRHGLDHLDQALDNGASAVAWEPAAGITPPTALPAVAVDRLSQTVGEIAARFHGRPSEAMSIVGITGTDGKTSTAHLLAQALERLDQPCAYLGTLGYGRLHELASASHTTPDAVRLQAIFANQRERGVKAVAMEVSSHALDQYRVGGTRFEVAVLTNISRDHLDYHGTVENYAAAKKRLFSYEGLKARVLNRDDRYGREWAAELGAQATVYGIGGNVPAEGRYVLAEMPVLTADGIAFRVRSSWGLAEVRSGLLGRFNVYNLLAVLTVLLEKGIALDQASAVLGNVHTVPGRIEGYRGPKAAALVVVDYAHTPQALEQILTAVRAHCTGQLWCVFGCGGDRDRGKRPLMGAAALQHADAVIVTDDNPRSESPQAIVAEILAGRSARVIHDRADALRTAVREAKAGDVVVVAGKGHETTQTYGADVREFSDRQFVADLVGTTRRN